MKFVERFKELMKHEKNRVAFMVSCAIISLVLSFLAIIVYMSASITAWTFCTMLLIMAIILLIPGFIGLYHYYKNYRIRIGKSKPKN